MNTALVLAAGSGARMGSAVPKQFLSVGGEPIYITSIRRFAECERIDEIVLAVPEAYVGYAEKELLEIFPDKKIYVISGGRDRPETLEKLVDFVFSKFTVGENDILLTHDAVRPYIDSRIINDNIDAAAEYGGCGTVVPSVDTIFQSADGEFISSVPDRAGLFCAQTPQSFNALLFREALGSLSAEKKSLVTDACSVFILCGLPVKMVMGSPENIKITYPADLDKR